jgi:hypothetical protein
MRKSKETRGRPASYPGEGRAVRLSFSAPESIAERLTAAVEQIGVSQSAIVLAGLRQILSQSPDRLRDAVAARSKRPAAERVPGGGAE